MAEKHSFQTNEDRQKCSNCGLEMELHFLTSPDARVWYGPIDDDAKIFVDGVQVGCLYGDEIEKIDSKYPCRKYINW